jgi:CRP-like cAMP-binding protein
MTANNPLSDFKFFSEVKSDSLEAIARLGEMVGYNTGDVIFDFDEPSNYLYALIDGQVDLSLVFKDKVLKTEIDYEEAVHTRIVEEEKSIVVDTVYSGQVFGWSSLVGPTRRTVTARCAQSSRIIPLPAADLKTMFEADPALGYVMMSKLSDIISKRLKKRTEKLIETWVEAFDVNKI